MPLIGLQNERTVLDKWQNPFIRKAKQEVQGLIKKLTDANIQHTLRKQLKLAEEPWENYLIHDAKHFLPILCHSTERAIEE